MSDFINSIQPRKSAIEKNRELLEEQEKEYILNTNVATKKLTNDPTVSTTNITTKVVTNVIKKIKIKPKQIQKLLTIRITPERLEKVTKLAEKHKTTRQEIFNNAIDNL